MTDELLAPSDLRAKLQLALTEPEFTLTRCTLNRYFWRAIKEELRYYPLLQSVFLAEHSRVSLSDVSTPLGMGALRQRAVWGIPHPGIGGFKAPRLRLSLI